MKLFILAALCLAFCSQYLESRPSEDSFTQEQLDFFANLQLSDLPRRLQILLTKASRTGGDSSHWCCKTDTSLPLNYTKVSKVVSHIIKEAIHVQVGEHSCGFLGTSKCSDEDVRYQEKVITHLTWDLVPNILQCPDKNVVCCHDYVLVAQNCIEFATLHEYKDDLLAFQQAGILG